MKNILLLIILPVVFTLYSFAQKNAEGPNYNYSLADPSYVYLLNSLTMSEFESSGHTDHPGTPLQITGAVILKSYFAFFHEKDNIAEDVIYRPESYLRVLDHTLIVFNALGLFLAGLLIFKIYKIETAAMIFQTLPFVSISLLEVYSLVKPENIAFFLILLQIVLIMKYVYDLNSSGKNYYIYISGLLCGIILSLKISFLCIIILPLIIFPGIRQKAVFTGSVILVFVVSIFPVISNMEYFISWVSDLFLHSGRYGTGESTIINSNDFFKNILKIISNEKYYIITYLFIISVIIFLKFKKKDNDQTVSPKEKKLCTALFIAMSLQIILVAKHYSSRYMFPALILSVPALFVSANIYYRIYLSKYGAKFLYTGLLSFLLLFGFYNCRKQLAKSNYLNSECLKITDYINTNYKDASVVLSPGVTSESAALLFAYYYTPEVSRPELKKLISQRFPDIVWYDVFNNMLFTFEGEFDTDNLTVSGKPYIYRTSDENYNNAFIKNYEKLYNTNNIKLTKLFSNENGELIYKIE